MGGVRVRGALTHGLEMGQVQRQETGLRLPGSVLTPGHPLQRHVACGRAGRAGSVPSAPGEARSNPDAEPSPSSRLPFLPF